MMFHCTRRVKYRQGRLGFRLESVVCASMIKIVTQTSNQEAQDLEVRHKLFHLASFQHRKHCLRNVQCVPPIVILYWSKNIV